MTTLQAGNATQFFLGGDTCLRELLRVLESAHHHIHVETMVFYNDKTGRAIAEVLKNKALVENVEVRVLVNFPATEFSIPTLKGSPDSPSSTDPADLKKPGLTLPFYEELRSAGVQVINSHPLSNFGTDIQIIENEPLEILVSLLGLPAGALMQVKQLIMWGYWRREKYDKDYVPLDFMLMQEKLDLQHKTTFPVHLDHRKLVVVDGREAVICCYNLGRDYLYEAPSGPTTNEGFWLDGAVSIQGPVVAQVQRAFAERWMLSAGDIFARDFLPSPSNPYIPVNASVGTDVVKILTSGYESAEDNPIRNEIENKLRDVSSRGKPVTVVNPYICDDYLVNLLIDAAGQGSEVIVICSDHHLDSPWSRDAGHLRYKRMVEAGIEICEYPGRMLHVKVMTIGSDWATVGSYNWNYRSARRDLECNAFIISTGLVGQISTEVEAMRRAARAVVRPAVVSGAFDDYPIGCLSRASYAALPVEVRAMLESTSRGTTFLEDWQIL